MIKTRQKIYKKPENKKYFGPKVIDHKGDLEKEIEEAMKNFKGQIKKYCPHCGYPQPSKIQITKGRIRKNNRIKR